ncbi:hypothetical protein BVG16_12215 [Paenibacillus selenitireducens]|uniref:Uncharacterized protein n=1 Tax=Paenibacillus selenitireducens TaxID=1324314 RepID=A0A1T2XG72_9BACL|nr:hypothetical protein [Paenibacillus selenitireducens]OPA78623.1 hypothetical protein BVG16_12215 [Paenibacillus selenitireducens]
MNMKHYHVVVISILSIVFGLSYIYGLVFSFQFLGPVQGIVRGIVQLWGKISIAIGMLILLMTIAIRYVKGKFHHLDAVILALLIIIFFLQLIAFLLWLFIGSIVDPMPSSLNALPHLTMIVILVRSFKRYF